jgi:hypothetical protein
MTYIDNYMYQNVTLWQHVIQPKHYTAGCCGAEGMKKGRERGEGGGRERRESWNVAYIDLPKHNTQCTRENGAMEGIDQLRLLG